MAGEYIGRHEKLYDVRRPWGGKCIVGECWYRCPKCGGRFTYEQTLVGGGFDAIRCGIVRHRRCGQLINVR